MQLSSAAPYGTQSPMAEEIKPPKFEFVMTGKLPDGNVRVIKHSSDDYEEGLRYIEFFRKAFPGNVIGELGITENKV